MKEKTITFNYKHFLKKETIASFLERKDYSSDYIYHLIEKKMVRINDKIVESKNEILPFFKMCNISVRLLFEKNTIPPLQGNLTILYEDQYLLIVFKHKNMDIEPTKKNYYKTLSNIISYYYQAKGIHSKIHLVNRLDKLTDGIVIVAKSGYIHHVMSKVNIIKKYKTIVKGKVDDSGVIKVNIKKDDDSVFRVASEDGKPSVTKYRLLSYDSAKDQSLVDIDLVTGRTHQIRVSFDHIGHPLIGDPFYGNAKGFYRLSAYYVEFVHPFTKKRVVVELNNKRKEQEK